MSWDGPPPRTPDGHEFRDVPEFKFDTIPAGGSKQMPFMLPPDCRPIAVFAHRPVKVGRGWWRQRHTIKVLHMPSDSEYNAVFELDLRMGAGEPWWRWLWVWVRCGFSEQAMMPRLGVEVTGVPVDNYTAEPERVRYMWWRFAVACLGCGVLFGGLLRLGAMFDPPWSYVIGGGGGLVVGLTASRLMNGWVKLTGMKRP